MSRALLVLCAIGWIGCAADIPNGVYVCADTSECPPEMTCQSGLCFAGQCRPLSCADRLAQCGEIDDGCGGTLMCGGCGASEECFDNRCGCSPRGCEGRCGEATDGCGGNIQCGGCPSGQECGGAGVPDVCGPGTCVPRDCAEQGFDCGTPTDGCGSRIECGVCEPPAVCGGGTQEYVCECRPAETCDQVPQECGDVPDGCGGVVRCAPCRRENQTCSDGFCCPDPCESGDVCGETFDECRGALVSCSCTCMLDPTEFDNDSFPGAYLGTLAAGATTTVNDHNIYHLMGSDTDILRWDVASGGGSAVTEIDVLARDLEPMREHVLTLIVSCVAMTVGTVTCSGGATPVVGGCQLAGRDRIEFTVSRACNVDGVLVVLTGEEPGADSECAPYTLELTPRRTAITPG